MQVTKSITLTFSIRLYFRIEIQLEHRLHEYELFLKNKRNITSYYKHTNRSSLEIYFLQTYWVASRSLKRQSAETVLGGSGSWSGTATRPTLGSKDLSC
jgi:hypothetical protein